jgi:hypothetical protein
LSDVGVTAEAGNGDGATKASSSRNCAPSKRRPRAISELDRRTCDLDRRSLEFKRYEEVRAAVIADLGGEDAVTTAEAQITDKAAFIAMTLEQMQITALSGEQIDLQRYGELTDRLRRLFEAVGFSRRQRDVTPRLSQFVDGLARQKPIGEPNDSGGQPETEIQSSLTSGHASAEANQ